MQHTSRQYPAHPLYIKKQGTWQLLPGTPECIPWSEDTCSLATVTSEQSALHMTLKHHPFMCPLLGTTGAESVRNTKQVAIAHLPQPAKSMCQNHTTTHTTAESTHTTQASNTATAPWAVDLRPSFMHKDGNKGLPFSHVLCHMALQVKSSAPSHSRVDPAYKTKCNHKPRHGPTWANTKAMLTGGVQHVQCTHTTLLACVDTWTDHNQPGAECTT